MSEQPPNEREWTRTEAIRTLRWLGWSAVSFPVAVISYELAHYAAYRYFGFRGPTLHYGSASYAASDAFWRLMESSDITAAAQLVPPWQAGLAATAGLLATYLTVLLCVLGVLRRPHPFWVGLGLIAPLRFLGSVAIVLAVMLGRRGGLGSDEDHVATTGQEPSSSQDLHRFAGGVVSLGTAPPQCVDEREQRFQQCSYWGKEH